MRRLGLCLLLCLTGSPGWAQTDSSLERWGAFKASFAGPKTGNPFLDVSFGAVFRIGHRTVDADGFYDEDGQYRIRFMPDTVGEWSYTTRSNRPELDGKTGTFSCVRNTGGNHGPVAVRNVYHFGYADGSPYVPIGTTAYAWVHQGDALEEQTLSTLRGSPFNKIRMCIFPKDYVYNKNEPVYYPFPHDSAGVNDFSRFNPEFFRHLEKRIRQLMELGIEADLILFHPYDRWGYKSMPASVDDRYLRYTVARLSAFRNVWWSMANEWDFMKSKTQADFDRFFRIVQEDDPYQHLRSIHNGSILYDHSKPWVTRASVQGDDFARTPEYLSTWKKPVIWDECKYEGNIPRRWGDISASKWSGDSGWGLRSEAMWVTARLISIRTMSCGGRRVVSCTEKARSASHSSLKLSGSFRLKGSTRYRTRSTRQRDAKASSTCSSSTCTSLRKWNSNCQPQPASGRI